MTSNAVSMQCYTASQESFAQLRMLRFKPHSWKCRSPLLTSSDDPQTVWVRRRPALKNHRVVKLKRNFTMLHQRMSLNCQGAKSAAPPNYALVTRLPLGGSWYVRTRRSLRMSAELVLISQIQWFLRPSPSSTHVHNFFSSHFQNMMRFAESRKAFEDFEVSTQQELKAGVAHWIGVKLLVAAGCETVNPSQTEPSWISSLTVQPPKDLNMSRFVTGM